MGEAIKRGYVFYVSRRLRVFEDNVLPPMVPARGLTVSTAEELLRAPDPVTRRELAAQAAEQQWPWGEARRAVADLRNGPFQVGRQQAISARSSAIRRRFILPTES